MIKFTKLILFLCFTAVCTTSCTTKEIDQKSSQLAVLNSLKSHYTSSRDSVAIYQHSFEYEPKEINFEAYKTTDFQFQIPPNTFNIWQDKLQKNTKALNWGKWGWENSYFITQEQTPEYFGQQAGHRPPPSSDQKYGPLKQIYSFSIPLVADQYAFVKVGSRGINSWGVTIVILERMREGEWKIVWERNIITT